VTGDRPIRRLTAAAVLLVAGIAALVSFIHIEHLAATHGQTPLAAWLQSDAAATVPSTDNPSNSEP
jgi:hypothetical protein